MQWEWAREMAWCLRTWTVLPKYWGLTLHPESLTIIYKSNSRKSDTFFWPAQALYAYGAQTYIYVSIHTRLIE